MDVPSNYYSPTDGGNTEVVEEQAEPGGGREEEEGKEVNAYRNAQWCISQE